jgi:peptidoglycan/LPS O-acetylase OafA/YrhL
MRACAHPIPVYCGRICYGLYLYHYPIFQLIQQWVPPLHAHMVVLLVGWPPPLPIFWSSATSCGRDRSDAGPQPGFGGRPHGCR